DSQSERKAQHPLLPTHSTFAAPQSRQHSPSAPREAPQRTAEFPDPRRSFFASAQGFLRRQPISRVALPPRIAIGESSCAVQSSYLVLWEREEHGWLSPRMN